MDINIYIYIFAFIDIQIDRTLDWLKMDLLYFAHWEKGVVEDGEREQFPFWFSIDVFLSMCAKVLKF